MRALSRNTRRVTALTLAAALVIAVYLNWQYARADITPQTEDDTLMVSAEPVEAEAETAITDALPTEAEAASGVNKNYGEAQLVSVANDSGTRFFEQARLKREKAHDEAMDTLQKSLKSSSLTAEEKKEYTAQMAAGLEDLNAENEIETLVRAKGFADCLCFLQAGRADLTVMTAGEPLTVAQIAGIMQLDKPQVWELLTMLEESYNEENRGLCLRKVAGGYQLCAKPQHYALLKQLERVQEVKLSAAAMETLAIVAFKQPVTRGEMEAIRGVKVDGVVNTLLEYGLICEAGRKEALGRPILYATTDKFLLTFGLNSLQDLPALPDEDSSGPEQISLLDSLKDTDSNTQNDGV